MKERTLLVSALIACCIHALILFLNFGITHPILASVASSIEVELVGPPESASAGELQPPAAAEPERIDAPRPPPESKPKPTIEPIVKPKPMPEPIPIVKPVPLPEPELTPVPEPEPVPEVEIIEEVADIEVSEMPEQSNMAVPAEPTEGVTESVLLKKKDISTDVRDGSETPREDSGAETKSSAPTEYFMGTIDRSPAYVYNPKPAYPRTARRLGQQGTVVLKVEVLTSGRVGAVNVETPSGFKLLDEAAVKAVRKWRFVPGRKGSASVRTWVRIPIEFNLRD